MKQRRTRWTYPIQMALAIGFVLVVAFFVLGWYEPFIDLGRRLFPD